jgi:prophage antirepressor-like protein
MNAVIPHIFEDSLVRSIMQNDEPWFVGKDICTVLNIKDHHQSLNRLDTDERGGYAIPTPSGDQMMIIVSEAGVFRLIFRSTKPEAERFKRWLAHEVLPSLRRNGHFGKPEADAFDITTEALPVVIAKLQMVREARHLFGHERARALWKQMGLAITPEDHSKGLGEAQDCLNTILSAEYVGHSIRSLLMQAMDAETGAGEALRPAGVWAEPDEDGFVIANRNSELERIMKGTAWQHAGWAPVLRRLPGATPAKTKRYEPSTTSRGVFIPARLLDIGTEL